MQSTCKKCGAAIKNIVEINGKDYGTNCAETILGLKLPKNFSGDGQKYKKEIELQKQKFVKESANLLHLTEKGWNINQLLTEAASKAGNDWEKRFVRSVAGQVGATILLHVVNHVASLNYFDVKNDWNEDFMGSFPFRNYDLNDRYKKLSSKQIDILKRILNNK